MITIVQYNFQANESINDIYQDSYRYIKKQKVQSSDAESEKTDIDRTDIEYKDDKNNIGVGTNKNFKFVVHLNFFAFIHRN